jgi:hypothetical protein
MRQATFVHTAILVLCTCCVLYCAGLAIVMGVLCIRVGDVARYDLTGPPEFLVAARWAIPLVLASAVCAIGALVLAGAGLASRMRCPG